MTFSADIYKVCCLDTDVKDIYVGSTRSFRQRKSHHKQACNNPNITGYNMYVYQFIRDHGGWVNWSMISIFTGNFETKLEMHRKEREYIEELGATLNKVIPTRTDKEYRIENSDKIKQYRIENADYFKQYQKQYNIDNADKIKEQTKQYRQNNSDIINTKQKQKFTCDCGGKYTKVHKQEHFKSKKHIKHFNPTPVHLEV
jgi:hypothetical protein